MKTNKKRCDHDITYYLYRLALVLYRYTLLPLPPTRVDNVKMFMHSAERYVKGESRLRLTFRIHDASNATVWTLTDCSGPNNPYQYSIDPGTGVSYYLCGNEFPANQNRDVCSWLHLVEKEYTRQVSLHVDNKKKAQ